MKKIFIWTMSVFFLSGFTSMDNPYRYIYNDNFSAGEKLEYRVHYGLVNAGEAVMEISDQLFNVNDRTCFKIDVYGRTTGVFNMLHKVRDNWGAYVDTMSLIPQKSYVHIEEGKYTKHEVISFNHIQKLASVGKFDKKNKKLVETNEYPVPQNVQDIIGGCYFLRTIDYDHIKDGQTISIPAFYGGKAYDFNLKVTGFEKIKTKLGEFDAVVLSPIIPENKFFDGENPVKIWISNDKQKIPLKIQAKLKIGSLEVDIKNVHNLRM